MKNRANGHRANLLVSEEDIDNLAAKVRNDHVDLMTAVDLLQLDSKTVLKLKNEGADPDAVGLARYAYDQIRQAEAEAETAILKVIHDPDGDPQRGKLLLSFLEATRSKYSKRYSTRIEYEVEMLIEHTARFVDKARLMEWIISLQQLSGKQAALDMDERLLG